MTDFVNLHVHSHYSILDALSSPKELIERAKELGQKAIAITDHGTLAASWNAYKASKDSGVKLIIGCEMYFLDDVKKTDQRFRHVILLAKNAIGYKNLLSLNKEGFDNSVVFAKRVYPIIDWTLLEKYSEGLICLTSCSNGIIAQLLMNRQDEEAEKQLNKLISIFGKDNLGLEIQANNLKRGSNIYNDAIEQFFVNRKIFNLSKKYDLRCVATTNSHYINKEDSKTHDVMLAIGSHQTVHSNFRLKYDSPEFYVKTGDEVKSFFERNYGDSAVEFCENTIFFANQCEEPIWIDPKFSNPSGKELPLFPIKDESDYNVFLDWKNNQSDDLKLLDEDKLYLRYKCYHSFDEFKKTIPEEKHKLYLDRIIYELETLEYQGFSSYMLIVADYVNWCKSVKIPVGPGRGCLVGSTKVLTDNGFVSLSEIKENNFVFSHTGTKQKVIDTFKFDVSNETLLKIKTVNSFDDISLTKDHKLYASKHKITDRYNYFKENNFKSTSKIKKYEDFNDPEWIQAKDLKINDVIYTTFPKRNIDESLLPKSFNIKYNLVKCGKYTETTTVNFDNEFIYWVGRFAGDGWMSSSSDKNYVAMCFNSNDLDDINNFINYFNKIQLRTKIIKHKTKNLVQIHLYNRDLSNKFHEFFPDYKSTSGSKHLPIFFRNLNDDGLKALLNGLLDSDGSKKELDRGRLSNRFCIDSTSYRMINEVKEALLYLKTKSSVNRRAPFMRGEYLCNESFKLRFKKEDFEKNEGHGYYSKILDIKEVKEDFVYDITVENDHSYLTSNYIVHNSVSGCFIAFLLNIHMADSIKYDLIFERFQNKLRMQAPDIDQDVSTIHRGRVLDYLKNKYGEDHMCAISNFNTITPKVYMRDMARALELNGSREEAVKLGNDLAGIISYDVAQLTNFNKILERTPLLAEYCKKYPELKECQKILGKPRAQSQHAAGIIISKRSLTGLVPIRKDKDKNSIIEYDKDDAEQNGMIKMDILGLSTLDLIENAIKLIRKTNPDFNNEHLNYDANDEKTYDLISKGDTYGVFQFGTSGGTIELCKRVKPKSIEDLAIITTLARPAAASIRNDFIEAREGKKQVVLLHPSLENAFKKTHGFGLFDESILQIGRDVAGWNYNDADRIRKMIKDKGKNPDKEKKLREEFIQGAIKNGVNTITAPRIWDEEVGKFASYTFNKAHAIVYSFISYQTAYLKAHYPVEFLLANLMAEVKSNTPDAKVNISKIKKEIRAHKIKITPPDINTSELTYTLSGSNKLTTGLDALKFVSDDAIKDIVSKRPFKNFFDFMLRVDSKKVRSNSIQALAASGALDSFKIPKKLIFYYCSDYRKKLQVWIKKHDPSKEEFSYPWPTEKEWSLPELYALETFYLGEGFCCGKKDAYGVFFSTNDPVNIFKVKKVKDKTLIPNIKVQVKDFFEFKVKKEGSKYLGMPMIKATVEDVNNDQCSLTIFPDTWKQVQDRISAISKKYKFEEGVALSLSGMVNIYEDDVGIILDKLYDFKPVPQLPEDLKAKKVNLKLSRKERGKEEEISPTLNTTESLYEELEDMLYDEGLIDLDEEDSTYDDD